MERGQYPLTEKEHIANGEQIVYTPLIAIRQRPKERKGI